MRSQDFPDLKTPRAGLEPATIRLTAGRSTIELPRSDPSTDYKNVNRIRQDSPEAFCSGWGGGACAGLWLQSGGCAPG